MDPYRALAVGATLAVVVGATAYGVGAVLDDERRMELGTAAVELGLGDFAPVLCEDDSGGVGTLRPVTSSAALEGTDVFEQVLERLRDRGYEVEAGSHAATATDDRRAVRVEALTPGADGSCAVPEHGAVLVSVTAA